MAAEADQFEMLRRMATLDPAPCFMGGYAEDALLAGTITRAHEDFDWLLTRAELPERRAQAQELGFSGFETWGEAAPGEPFYLFSQGGGMKLDLGIADEEDSALWMKVHRLFFEVDGGEPPAGYRVRMPDDTFEHPPTAIDGVTIRVASPRALYLMRRALAEAGSFGELSERQRESADRLRQRFLRGLPDAELVPRVEPLA